MLKARQHLDAAQLTPALVYKNLCRLFPRVNDYSASPSAYENELSELYHFSIITNKQLRLLLKKHRKNILRIDRSLIDPSTIQVYKDHLEPEELRDHMRRQYWFAYPAILRLALELEYGNEYLTYADQRDGIE